MSSIRCGVALQASVQCLFVFDKSVCVRKRNGEEKAFALECISLTNHLRQDSLLMAISASSRTEMC